MSPVIVALRDVLAAPFDNTQTQAPGNQPVRTWIIVAVAFGTPLFVCAVVFVTITVLRRRRFQLAKAADPYLSRDEFRRRSRMTELDRNWDDEQKRRMIIRKSLATRSSQSSISSRSREGSISSETESLFPALNNKITTDAGTATAPPIATPSRADPAAALRATAPARTATMAGETGSGEDDDDEETSPALPKSPGRPASLRDDWKEYEASIRRQHSQSREVHPAADLRLPHRTLTRSRSSRHGSLLNHSLPPLPTIAVSDEEDEVERRSQARAELVANAHRRIPSITIHRAA